MSWQDLRNQHCESSYFETIILQKLLPSNIAKQYLYSFLSFERNKYNYVTNNYPNRWESKSSKKIQNTFCFIATQILDIKKHWELNLGLAKIWKMGIKTEDIPGASYFRRCSSKVTWRKAWIWKLVSTHSDIPTSWTVAAPWSICSQSQLFGTHQECFLIIICN